MAIYSTANQSVQIYTSAPKPNYLKMSEPRPSSRHQCADNGDGTGTWYLDIALQQKQALTAIDTAAGEVRSRYVSSGDYIDAEYTLAAQQAAEWTANGQMDDAVPAAVKAWADAEGISAKDAADDITTKANAWQAILLKVRTLRLAGKAAIDNADDDADFELIAQDYTAKLEAL